MEGEQRKAGNSIPKKMVYPNPPDPHNPKKVVYPNPPDTHNPDTATLREQWKFAVRQYSKWYSHAWGTAIFAGFSLFALGWYIKGGNPLDKPSINGDPPDKQPRSSTS